MAYDENSSGLDDHDLHHSGYDLGRITYRISYEMILHHGRRVSNHIGCLIDAETLDLSLTTAFFMSYQTHGLLDL